MRQQPYSSSPLNANTVEWQFNFANWIAKQVLASQVSKCTANRCIVSAFWTDFLFLTPEWRLFFLSLRGGGASQIGRLGTISLLKIDSYRGPLNNSWLRLHISQVSRLIKKLIILAVVRAWIRSTNREFHNNIPSQSINLLWTVDSSLYFLTPIYVSWGKLFIILSLLLSSRVASSSPTVTVHFLNTNSYQILINTRRRYSLLNGRNNGETNDIYLGEGIWIAALSSVHSSLLPCPWRLHKLATDHK